VIIVVWDSCRQPRNCRPGYISFGDAASAACAARDRAAGLREALAAEHGDSHAPGAPVRRLICSERP